MMAAAGDLTEEKRQCEKIASEALMTLHVEGELSHVCEILKVSDVIQRKARHLWKEIQSVSDLNTSDDIKPWFACCLYITAIDISFPYGMSDPAISGGTVEGPGFTVTDLLKAADVKITLFFEKMRDIRKRLDLSKTVLHQLVTLEKRYCIVSAMFNKFEALFKEVFRDETHLHPHQDPNVSKALNPQDFNFNKQLCWALFLLAKGAYLGENQELLLAFDFLVCCVDYVICNTPAFQLLPPFDSLRLSTNCHTVEETFLRKLCEHCNTSYERVNYVKKTYTDQFIHSLKNDKGWLEIDHLIDLYSGIYSNERDIDEMLFLQHDRHLLPMIPKAARPSDSEVTKKEVPMTPIRSALSSVQQLQKALKSGCEGPSEKLQTFFKNCSKCPEQSVLERVKLLQGEFVTGVVAVIGDKHRSIGEERFKMATSLYYRVMEALLTAEEERLSKKDFSILLNTDVFHRSLLACSAEVVMTVYGVSWNTNDQSMNSEESDFAFPWILSAFSLKAYDFYKVLESFIRAETNLTKEIIRHLQGVENRILESIAWGENSPLFDALSVSEPATISFAPSSPSENNNIPSASAAQLYLSPAPGMRRTPCTPPSQKVPPLGVSSSIRIEAQTVSPSAGTRSPAKQPPLYRSQSLNIFFNKVCRLGHHRLQTLCNFLDVPKDLQQKIWTCFEHCITHKAELMKNRHLDQIMMCSIFAICKVQRKEIKFRTIVNMYKNLPNASPHVYKNAVISDNNQDNIIIFYNKVFMISLKTYILQFSVSNAATPILSPEPKPVNGRLLASPTYTIPGKKNFTVSSLRSPFKTPIMASPMTPRTKALFCFGELNGSSEKFQQINDRMTAIRRLSNQTPIRGSKRLCFDQEEPNNSDNEVPVKVRREVPGLIVKPSGSILPCLSEKTNIGSCENSRNGENKEEPVPNGR